MSKWDWMALGSGTAGCFILFVWLLLKGSQRSREWEELNLIRVHEKRREEEEWDEWVWRTKRDIDRLPEIKR